MQCAFGVSLQLGLGITRKESEVLLGGKSLEEMAAEIKGEGEAEIDTDE